MQQEDTKIATACQASTLDPRVRELLELHQTLTMQRLAEPDPEGWDRLTAQMASVRERMREIEDQGLLTRR